MCFWWPCGYVKELGNCESGPENVYRRSLCKANERIGEFCQHQNVGWKRFTLLVGSRPSAAQWEEGMRLLVVGAGATGGYFGGRLAHAGRDVTFLVRPRRAAELEATGLRVVSPHGGFELAPKLVTAGAIPGHFDAILLTVKAHGLEQSLEDLAPAVGPDTMIVPVLNGMRHMDVIADRFGKDALTGGLCRIPAQLDGEGRIVQLGSFHDLEYGELGGSRTPRIERLDAFMQNAGFDARLAPDIGQEMWEKWVMIATVASITCLMRGSVGEIAAAPGGAAFVNGLLDEVAAIAAAAGHPPREAYLAGTRADATRQGSPMTASMFRDMQKGAPIEADQIVGDLLARGQRANVPAPLLAAAYTHLCVYQNRKP
jgi:2-dehydropantoate 2-reductase